MKKNEFVSMYGPLIRVHFNPDELLSDPGIEITETEKPLSLFPDFYVPRYKVGGKWDDRPIELIKNDDTSSLVQLRDVLVSPTDWDLVPFADAAGSTQELWPIPIATDKSVGKTLLLDSNHTVCTMLLSGIRHRRTVRCIEIIGECLAGLGADLQAMHESRGQCSPIIPDNPVP